MRGMAEDGCSIKGFLLKMDKLLPLWQGGLKRAAQRT
jgi:hypothetical protein